MAKFIDLTGRQYGRLSVLSINHKQRVGETGQVIYWNCLCDCGNQKVINGVRLRDGRAINCGCERRGTITLEGKKYGMLLVLKKDRSRRNRYGYVWWECKCDCGTVKSVRASNLKSGETLSCGCLHKIRVTGPKLRHGLAVPSSRSTEYLLWCHSKTRARVKGLPFEILPQDVIIPEFCPIFGTPLVASRGGQSTNNSPSLDRLIPELGYTRDNISVISRRANTIKNDATPEELRLIADFMDRRAEENKLRKEEDSI